MKKVLSALIVLVMLVGCGQAGIKKEDAYSKFNLMGVEYELPMPLEKLQENGWVVSEFDETTSLKPMTQSIMILSNEGNEIVIVVSNPTDSKITSGFIVNELSIEDGFVSKDYEFYGGIKLDDDFKKVNKQVSTLDVKNYSEVDGVIAYGNENKELSFRASSRGRVNSIEIINYGNLSRYDFDFAMDDSEEEDEWDDSDLDVSWFSKSESEIRKEGDENRNKNPLSNLDFILNQGKTGVYKIEGKVVKGPKIETDIFYVKDKDGATVVMPYEMLKKSNAEINFEEGKDIVVYVSQLFVTKETMKENVVVAPFTLIADYEGKTYSAINQLDI